MTNGSRRTRLERVAAFELPPDLLHRMLERLTHRDVLARLGFALGIAVVLCILIHGWSPPFVYRAGYVPTSDIVASVPFVKPDHDATEEQRELARKHAPQVYSQNKDSIVQLLAGLENALKELAKAKSLEEVRPELWQQFTPPAPPTTPPVAPQTAHTPASPSAKVAAKTSTKAATPASPHSASKSPTKEEKEKMEAEFAEFHAKISGKEGDEENGEEKLTKIMRDVAKAFERYEKSGFLDKPPANGNQKEILVYQAGHPNEKIRVPLSQVLLGDGAGVRDELEIWLDQKDLAARFFAWLRPKLATMNTLTLDEVQTHDLREKAAENVQEVFVKYERGQILAEAGVALGARELELLKREYQAALENRTKWQRILRTIGMLAILLFLIVFCVYHLRLRAPEILKRLSSLITTTTLVIVTVAVAEWAARDPWHAEIVPILLFGQVIAIAYKRELALVLTGFVTLIVLLGLGLGLGELLVLLGAASTAIFQLDTIRNRSKLIMVGITSGLVASMLTLAVGLLNSQPLGWPLLSEIARNAGLPIAAGFLMTGLLPLIERFFGVLTDISLLVLGDVAHPLLQELVRRAPSTYNHSITVGTIAEAAADSIGARGLLVRIGAYFHDIGKMLKPGYYIENQGTEQSRHEGLVPAMSSLVIIAHIKDGANLARQHRLPQAIVDFILQHHGTTLVGYFYQQASRLSEADPDAAKVDESTFRYPGPKPQTKEAAVLMLADAVESASRTLVGPTPARIENLVRELADRRLEDGQFDESGLTLRELRTIETSMVKSVTAIYHGRVKYPDQKTE